MREKSSSSFTNAATNAVVDDAAPLLVICLFYSNFDFFFVQYTPSPFLLQVLRHETITRRCKSIVRWAVEKVATLSLLASSPIAPSPWRFFCHFATTVSDHCQPPGPAFEFVCYSLPLELCGSCGMLHATSVVYPTSHVQHACLLAS